MAGGEGVFGHACGGAAAAFAFGFGADEFAGAAAFAAFAGAALDFHVLGHLVAGDALGGHVGDGAVHRIPACTLVEGVGEFAGEALHFLREVFFLVHQVADHVLELLGQLRHFGVVLGDRLFHLPVFAVGFLLQPAFDVGGEFFGFFEGIFFEGGMISVAFCSRAALAMASSTFIWTISSRREELAISCSAILLMSARRSLRNFSHLSSMAASSASFFWFWSLASNWSLGFLARSAVASMTDFCSLSNFLSSSASFFQASCWALLGISPPSWSAVLASCVLIGRGDGEEGLESTSMMRLWCWRRRGGQRGERFGVGEQQNIAAAVDGAGGVFDGEHLQRFLHELHGGFEGEIFGQRGDVVVNGFLAFGNGGGEGADVVDGDVGEEGGGLFAEGDLAIEQGGEFFAQFVPEFASFGGGGGGVVERDGEDLSGRGLAGRAAVSSEVRIAVVGGDEAVAEGVAEFVVGGGEVEDVS